MESDRAVGGDRRVSDPSASAAAVVAARVSVLLRRARYGDVVGRGNPENESRFDDRVADAHDRLPD